MMPSIFLVTGELPECDADLVLQAVPATQAAPPRLLSSAPRPAPAAEQDEEAELEAAMMMREHAATARVWQNIWTASIFAAYLSSISMFLYVALRQFGRDECGAGRWGGGAGYGGAGARAGAERGVAVRGAAARAGHSAVTAGDSPPHC